MALTNRDSRFLGIKTSGIRHWFAQFARFLQSIPPLSWLVPDVPVRVFRADGVTAHWLMGGAGRSSSPMAASRARFFAVEIPESMVLHRQLQMPAIPAAELFDALALDVRSNSPFASDDLVWGYRCVPGSGGAHTPVHLALASRKRIEAHVQAAAQGAELQQTPEAWVLRPNDQPLVLNGFGEAHRQKYLAAWTRVNIALLSLAVLLLIGICLTPSLQLRMRAIEARSAFDAERARVEPTVKKRAEFMAMLEQVQDLRKLTQERLDPLAVMDRLTQILPDDTSILTLSVLPQKINLTGQTANAAALMKHLSSQPGVKDVKAPAAAVRPAGATKDSFTIELVLGPVALPLASVASAPVLPASAPAVPASAASQPMPPASKATP